MIQKIYKPIIILTLTLIFLGVFLIFAENAKATENSREIKAIRKVLIVSKGQLEEGIKKSIELGVPEVAEGIPPILKDKVTEGMLPYVYEEIIYETPDPLKEEMKKALEKFGADIAEYYPVADESIEAGDVVSVSNQSGLITSATSTKYLVEKSSQPYDQKLMGVISSDSAMIINSGDSSNPESKATLRPIALTGRVPVKVSLENGEIKIGDYLTSSQIPGVAMRVTKAGKTIGMALDNFDESEIVNQEIGTGTIMVFVNVDWYGGETEEGFSFSGFTSNLFDWILGQFKKIGVFVQQNLVRVQRIFIAALTIEKGPIPEENTIGEGVILSGAKEITIYNNNVKPTSKIFVTFRGDYQGRWWASEVGERYFKITLSEMALQDVTFDYWIVGVGEPVLEGNLGLPSEDGLSGEEPPTEEPPAEEVCDTIHLNLCATQTECEATAGFWYNEGCNAEPPNQEQSSGTGQAEIPACTPVEEICDGVDNDCDGVIDEEVDCGTTSCDASLNLAGQCQNTCMEGSCQICIPTCSCAESFSDCDGDMGNGCEVSGDCPSPEPPEE